MKAQTPDLTITQTDFIHYLNCPKSFWLLKKESKNYPFGNFSLFMKKLVREGYEVEKYVRQFFLAHTEKSMDFQKVFKTNSGLFARADSFEKASDGKCILYEIKSSTSVKTDEKHNHIKDACFQKISAEKSGQQIDQVFIIHLNSKYVRQGDINPEEMLVFNDVTNLVDNIYKETVSEIDNALAMLKMDNINRSGCSCIYKSQANHCDTFSYFNPDVPELSIYNLPRLSEIKRHDLVAKNITDIKNIPENFQLSEIQNLVRKATVEDRPQIDRGAIRRYLCTLQFPLYFFDYETYSSAIPMIDGVSPHKHFPVQYSLHILHDDSTLEHKDFLQREPKLPSNLINQMEMDFGDVGSIVSWHASFEKTQNREMAKWFPEKKYFLTNISDRMVDLEDIFKKSYVDARFKGSTSIKNILPIICPHLGYEGLEIQNGMAAMDAWQQMINAVGDGKDIRSASLLKYCELDTFAMVEIFRFLSKLVS